MVAVWSATAVFVLIGWWRNGRRRLSVAAASSFCMAESDAPSKGRRRRHRRGGGGPQSIVLHPLANISNTCPLLFVSTLKFTFIKGKGKSRMKFHDLRELIINSLPTAPSPGPATFVVYCLGALLFVEPPFNEGLSYLLISALNHLNSMDRSSEDAAVARKLAASLFYDAVVGRAILEARLVVRLVVGFSIQLKDVQEAMSIQSRGEERTIKDAKAFIQPFILKLIREHSYNSIIALSKHFDLDASTLQEFLISMILDGQPELAGHWAAYLGRDMIFSLVQHCTERGMLKMAHRFVENYGLHEEFPDAYYLYKKSLLQKLVRKGLWHLADNISEEDPQLSKYLELCRRSDGNEGPFLVLQDIIPEDSVIWVDSLEGLVFAEKCLSNANVVGFDCEWKANAFEDQGPIKVSILQLATSEVVFIFDLILLSEQESSNLDRCVKSIFQSKNILKLGYAVHNDMKRLVKSYEDLECFYTCEYVLDLQKVAGNIAKGGLSGLTKVALGNYLDKQTQMSNWEERPLSISQMHYAALDALVLLSIFDCICSGSIPTVADAAAVLPDWKEHVMSFRFMERNKKETTSPGTYLQDGYCSRRSTKDPWIDKSLQDSHCSESHMITRLMSTTITSCTSYDDLVFASCELVGLPVPGLLKDELLNITQAARLPPPSYRVFSIGPKHAGGFCAIVKVADQEFCGLPAFTKKEATICAAQAALIVIQKGSHNII